MEGQLDQQLSLPHPLIVFSKALDFLHLIPKQLKQQESEKRVIDKKVEFRQQDQVLPLPPDQVMVRLQLAPSQEG